MLCVVFRKTEMRYFKKIRKTVRSPKLQAGCVKSFIWEIIGEAPTSIYWMYLF